MGGLLALLVSAAGQYAGMEVAKKFGVGQDKGRGGGSSQQTQPADDDAARMKKFSESLHARMQQADEQRRKGAGAVSNIPQGAPVPGAQAPAQGPVQMQGPSQLQLPQQVPQAPQQQADAPVDHSGGNAQPSPLRFLAGYNLGGSFRGGR